MLKNLLIATATAATIATGSLAFSAPAEAHPHMHRWHRWHFGPVCHKEWVKRHHHWVRITVCRRGPWY